jgi:glycosyltransferase involved in cell wall biosynthesis
MRVGIEGKALTRRIGGIGRCAINLLQALQACMTAECPDMELVVFTAPQTAPEVLADLKIPVCRRFEGVKSTLLRSAFCLARGVVSERIDVFHGLDQSDIPFFSKKSPYVVTLHDILPLMLPWAFPLKHRLVSRLALARVRQQADGVLVPSTAVKHDVMERLRIPADRIFVVPWGCEAQFQPSGDPLYFEGVKARYGLPARYLLFVGTLEPRKGLSTLLHAFARLRASHPNGDLKLVIAGGQGWGDETLRTTQKTLKLHHDVIFTGFIDELDLPHLYRGALLFVYPSLSEGFGLPILEAMACGTPVITSTTSSMPEVAGEAAILVEPGDPEALATALALLLNDEARRDELRRRGIRRARQFTWQAVARQTLQVYRRLAER